MASKVTRSRSRSRSSRRSRSGSPYYRYRSSSCSRSYIPLERSRSRSPSISWEEWKKQYATNVTSFARGFRRARGEDLEFWQDQIYSSNSQDYRDYVLEAWAKYGTERARHLFSAYELVPSYETATFVSECMDEHDVADLLNMLIRVCNKRNQDKNDKNSQDNFNENRKLRNVLKLMTQ